MADTDKPKSEGRAESPTTARELDFDDDEPASNPQTPAKDVSHASITAKSESGTPAAARGAGGNNSQKDNTTNTNTPSNTAQQQPPARPMSPQEQAAQTLREAFPSIDGSVVKAVLAASGGQVEPAFNALLGMTDPESAAQNEQQQQQAPPQLRQSGFAPPPGPPPPQPPRRQPQAGAGGARSQLEADELYARQLAEHYERQDARRVQRQQRGSYGEEDRERNFIDDDLPEIGENIRKGFLETQQKFNGWLSGLKKRMDGDEEDAPPALPARRQPATTAPRRSSELYDADPEEFGNDFSRLELRDDTTSPTGQQGRKANPDLFKPTPPAPQDGRRVSFQDGPPEEIGAGTKNENGKMGSKGNSKWQPLSAVEPSPVGEHDPFSLGDSDEEESKKGADKKDTKDTKDGKTDKDTAKDSSTTKSEGASGLEKATAEAMAGEIGDESGGKLELKDNTDKK